MATTEPTTAVHRRLTGSAVAALAYALLGYAAFLAVIVYAVAFLADTMVPRTVDHGGPVSPPRVAVAVDVLLVALFAIQHSVMARPAFKRRWVQLVPAHVERSTYVLAASAALALLFWQWRPMPHLVWEVRSPAAHALVWSVYAAGWLWAVAMSFAIDHLDLVGLSQVAHHLRGRGDPAQRFALPLPYRLVRHPMMLGFFVAFVATPRMTVGHLLFAALGSAYIVVGVRLEERDLTAALPPYAAYARRTPRFLPRRRRPR
jgi:methanethiol S-methyltransferase